jgi:Leucine-rich repeat (LRR) protein
MYNLGLSHIPQSFESLVNLRTLDLRNNALKVIPKLPGKLLELNLGDNLFEVLPDIANLKSLKDLYLYII